VRWKLLIIASLAAAGAGAGGSAGLLYLLTGRPAPTGQVGWAGLAALVLPLAAVTYASIFVYRHTARRRKLQAAATALVSLALSLALFTAFAFFTTCCAPPPAPAQPAPKGVS
jgi:ABC-type transport system involved in multi-copper enzyme maturation permease subunit